MKILIIEDELPMRTALVGALTGLGYRVASANDGASGLEKALQAEWDLILLDVMLPRMDGYAVARELRQRGRATPILMLTAKGLVDDRVDGLDAGADDYLVKPFSMKELAARVRAQLRRRQTEESQVDQLQLGDAIIDFTRQSATKAGKPLELSKKELAILRLLAASPGAAVSRETFLEQVWEYNAYPTTRTVDNFIANLRAKLESDPANPRFLLTARGVGYRLGGMIG
jgi:DNA-binding response OmpR family regulator